MIFFYFFFYKVMRGFSFIILVSAVHAAPCRCLQLCLHQLEADLLFYGSLPFGFTVMYFFFEFIILTSFAGSEMTHCIVEQLPLQQKSFATLLICSSTDLQSVNTKLFSACCAWLFSLISIVVAWLQCFV